MTTRVRTLAVAVLAVVLIGASAAYVGWTRAGQQRALPTASTAHPLVVEVVEAGPRIVFRHSQLGPDYGKVAMVPLTSPHGARAVVDRQCDRVFATTRATLCLASDGGVVTTYSATVHGSATDRATPLQLVGSPSRARLSPDGRYAATTSFVAGDSYAATSFSTRTVVTRLADTQVVDLETFALHSGDRRIAPVDRNYWGVTFATDDDTFFVTVAYDGATHLARGRLAERRIDIVRTDAECPSLSPDGTRLAYKKRGNRERGDWRLVVMDLATGVEKQLAERRSVDDQVEWLDDTGVLYGLPGEGSKAAESDVWVVPADGTGQPTVLIPGAWSPAVVR